MVSNAQFCRPGRSACRTLGLRHLPSRRVHGKLGAVSRSLLLGSLNSCHLASFFPFAAVADILGNGDEFGVALVA